MNKFMKINWLVGEKSVRFTLGRFYSVLWAQNFFSLSQTLIEIEIESININVIYLLLVYSPYTYTHFNKFWTLFLAQFSTWSIWRQRRWWLEVKKNVWENTTNPTNERTKERTKKKWMNVSSVFMHHEICTHFYVNNTKFHFKSVFFSSRVQFAGDN